jgi:hypothetical protein
MASIAAPDETYLWIDDLFRPHLAVSIRRMFGGAGVFTGDGGRSSHDLPGDRWRNLAEE